MELIYCQSKMMAKMIVLVFCVYSIRAKATLYKSQSKLHSLTNTNGQALQANTRIKAISGGF